MTKAERDELVREMRADLASGMCARGPILDADDEAALDAAWEQVAAEDERARRRQEDEAAR